MELERRIVAGEHPAGTVRQSVKQASVDYLARTDGELELADAIARAEDPREERRRELEPYRQEIEQRSKRSTTAQLTPNDAAARDILRDRKYELALANDRALIANAELAELRESVPTKQDQLPLIAEPLAVMLDGELIHLWAAERKPTKKSIDTHRAAARWLYDYTERKAVADITRKNVLSYKAKLLEAGQFAANIQNEA